MPEHSRSRPTPAQRRQVLHDLLDKVLDRSPHLERQLHLMLRRAATTLQNPETQLTLRSLSAGKALLDLVAELRGRTP